MERVAILGRHICGNDEAIQGGSLVMKQTSGGSEEQPPASREGKLTILDHRTNKQYEVGVDGEAFATVCVESGCFRRVMHTGFLLCIC